MGMVAEFSRFLMKTLTIGNFVIAKFVTPFNFVLLLIANLKLFGINLGIVHIILFLALGLATSMVIGFFYDRMGFWAYELKYDAERNPILHEIREMRDEIKVK